MDNIDPSCFFLRSRRYFEAAKKNYEEGSFGLALGNFFLVCKLTPAQSRELLPCVVYCLEKVTLQLEAAGRHQELLKIYESALEIFPASGGILSSLGEYLSRHGHTQQAAGCLQRALAADGAPATARDSLDRACAALVDRWHFTMLNDRRRNEAFDRAITAAVATLQPGALVLDLGAGTGLLSMMAVRAGAEPVMACESSQPMSEVCCAVLADNGMSDRVQLFNMSSLQLAVGDHLPKRASLLVTETFDAGLLGEHVLTSLDHAWRHLLLPGGRVLPVGATVHACAVQSDQLRRAHTAEWRGATLVRRRSEPYDSERLADLPGGYTQLTESVEVYRVNFNSREDIAAGLSGSDVSHVVQCTTGGRVDALVTWFELDMGDGEMLSSAPLAGTCWEQAVYAVTGDVTIETGDSVTLNVTCCGHISVTLGDVRPSPPELCSPAAALNGSAAERDIIELASDEAFEFAADSNTAEWLWARLDAWQRERSSLSNGVAACSVLDLCPVPVACGGVPGTEPEEPPAARAARREVWDAVLCCPLTASGRLDPAVLDTVQRVRLAPGGLLAPRCLLLYAVAVSSQLVRRMTSVEPDNTAGLDCSAINALKVSHVQGFPYACEGIATDLSEVTCVSRLDLATGVLDPATFALPLTSGGQMDGLVFWFQLADCSEERGPAVASGIYKQMVLVCEKPRQVQEGELVMGTVHRVPDGVLIVLEG